jgi:hypothetical protein
MESTVSNFLLPYRHVFPNAEIDAAQIGKEKPGIFQKAHKKYFCENLTQ